MFISQLVEINPGSAVTSPQFPSVYEAGIQCSKWIQSGNSTVIVMKSALNIDCDYDILQIKTNATTIDLCKESNDPIVVNTDFEIIFKADEIVDGPKTGFKLLLSTKSYDWDLCKSSCYCWGTSDEFNLDCSSSKDSFYLSI